MILRSLYVLVVGFTILLGLDIIAVGMTHVDAPLQGLLTLCAGPSWIRAALVGFFTGRALAKAMIL